MVKLLEDSFDFKQVPFIVKVERKTMYIDGDTGEINGINAFGKPTGYGENDRTPRSKVRCEVIIGTVRPDYPYPIRKEWPDDVDKHQYVVIPLEKPVKSRGLIFMSWNSEHVRDESSVDRHEIADATIAKLKKAYDDSDIQSLRSSADSAPKYIN